VEDMAGQDRTWMRGFFGPLWAWLMMGVGLALVASTYGLKEMGVSDAVAFVPFAAGVVIVLATMAYLVVQGRRTWRAWFWMFHLDDEDLLMGRKKDE
jgi:membrane protein YdbS with pleckstrin-like domain